ncbi:hypothetical protein ASF99_04700 [Exiguobacterium sp. Leaf187]|uniref:M15 family metallopeptidase n=1 Tax=Exiguobacterium sp. Leaf187 TaxID=1736294 RepID=UPI0006FE2D61|nr:M15 family metallopeptidase [Exiguobacterium sp. Leaf187]KQS19189.1 hypothetical protein ASF99_04700 [Exiguobacterium sp. Leaf187]
MTVSLQFVQEKANRKLDDPGLNPVVREMGKQLVKLAHAQGVPVCITQAYRSKAEQDALYAQGRTKAGKIVTNAPGGYSNHNYGLAIDFALYTPSGQEVTWSESADYDRDGEADWKEVVRIAKKLGFEWGGDWRGFRDAPHLEYTFGLTIAQLRAGKKPPTTKNGTIKPVTSVPVTGKSSTHRIVAGDTLIGIAKKFDVSVDELQKWNKLNGTTIIKGKELIVKKPAAKPATASGAKEAIVDYPGVALYQGAKGMKTEDITRIQNAVKVPATGQFDAATTKGVRNYQKRKGLEVDGVVGRVTWNTLF